MAITKRLNFDNIFLFLFLIIFPFGQIVKIGIINPIDLVVGAAAIYSIIKKHKKPGIFQYFSDFIFICFVSFAFSVFLFLQKELFIGVLYFIRLLSYFYFLVYVNNFVSKYKSNKKLLMGSLVGVSVISAIFGWIQYFAFPDIKPFFVFGWDEHLFRIVGTFLDPAFLSLILVFGIILTPNILVRIFLTLTLAFTYSRAGYAAFIIAIFSQSFYTKQIKTAILLLLLLVGTIFILPRPAGESVRLERTSSVYARLNNYGQTLDIIKKNPVFGVGFNNMCIARRRYIDIESFSSHSCSGSDSSLLFVLATTGIVGLISLIRLFSKVWAMASPVLKVSLLSLLIHSIFSNSIFYVWIMGWILILLSLEKYTKE